MADVSTPNLRTKVRSLTALLNEFNNELATPAPTGACLYNSGGETECTVTTETWCETGLQGTFRGGVCTEQSTRYTISKPDIDEGTLTRLVQLLNVTNSLLPHPAPLGACIYPSDTGEAYIVTTERACAVVFKGVFRSGEFCGEVANQGAGADVGTPGCDT